MSKLDLILNVLDDKKAERIVVIDLKAMTQVHQTMIVCDVENPRHLEAIKDYVLEALRKAAYSIHHVEGKGTSEWILVDIEDVVLHLFLAQTRMFYHIEDLWADQRLALPQTH